MRRIDNTPKGQVDINSLLNRNETQKPKHLATRTIRLINFCIDLIFVLFPLVLLVRYYLDFTIWYYTGQDWYWKTMFLIYSSVVFFYYFLFEKFVGKTIGQTFSKSKVVSAIGSKLTTRQISKRSLIRLLPIDCFSFLFQKKPVGFHDQFSKTYVVKTKKQQNNK